MAKAWNRFAACALVLLMQSQPVQARPANWQPVAIADDHSSWLFLDLSSIRHKGKKASVRVLLEYAEAQPGQPESNGQPYWMVRDLMLFDCPARTLLPLQEEYLDGEEGLLGEVDVSTLDWEPVLRDSLIEPVYNKLCSKP